MLFRSEGFTPYQIYYNDNVFSKSFFKIDLYDLPDEKAQTPYITIILPTQQGKTEQVTIAASGGARLVYETIASTIKFKDTVRVDHKGPVDALTDVVGGNVRFAIVPSVVANPFYKDSRIQIVALSSNATLVQMPEALPMSTALHAFEIGRAHV